MSAEPLFDLKGLDKNKQMLYNQITKYISKEIFVMFLKPEIEFAETEDVITASQPVSLANGGENTEGEWQPWF